MALYDIQRQSVDQTVQIFDAFYEKDLTVPTNLYDPVHSYFLKMCETKTMAENFTSIFFRLAQDNGVDPTVLFQELKGKTTSSVDLTRVMAFYFNSFKSKTSLYGVADIPAPNQPVARNVVL